MKICLRSIVIIATLLVNILIISIYSNTGDGILISSRSIDKEWFTEIIEAQPQNPYRHALEIDEEDRIHLIYNNMKSYNYSIWDGNIWTNEIIPGINISNSLLKFDLDTNNNPYMVYTVDFIGFNLTWHDGNNWHTTLVHNGSMEPDDVDMVVGGPLDVHLAYRIWKKGEIEYIHFNGTINSKENFSVSQPYGLSINLDSKNEPRISCTERQGNNLLYFEKNYGNWTKIIIPEGHGTLTYTKLQFNEKDEPHIAFTTRQDGDKLVQIWKSNDNWNREIIKEGISSVRFDYEIDNMGEAHAITDYNYYSYKDGLNWNSERIDLMYEYNQIDDPIEFDSLNNIFILSSTPSGEIILLTHRVENNQPISDAGSDIEVGVNEFFTLNGSNSYDDSGLVQYIWKIQVGDSLINLEGKIVDTYLSQIGTYNIKLRVIDPYGNWHEDIVIVVVLDEISPIVFAGPDRTILIGETISFNGENSYDNGHIINYNWTFIYEGIEYIFENISFSFTFNFIGNYTILLRVYDDALNAGLDEVNISVIDNILPIAVINGSRILLPGERLILDAEGSTDNGRIVKYQWTFDDGGPITILGEFLDYKVVQVGELVVTLTVWDASMNNDTVEVVITILDTENPVAVVKNDIYITLGRTAFFNGSQSTDNGRIVIYEWDFVYDFEEITLIGIGPEFTFDIAGVYQIILTVFDQSGNSGEITFNVNVIDTGSLEGEVKDENGELVVGATVTLTDVNGYAHTATTDSEGMFKIIDIPMGNVTYVVSMDGYEDFQGGEVSIAPMCATGIVADHIVLIEEEDTINPTPNPLVFIALVLMILIIVAVVVFMVIRFTRKTKDEETPPPDEDESTISEEQIEDEISSTPIEDETNPESLYSEPQHDLFTAPQEDVFGDYELPMDQVEQPIESPTEEVTEPLEDDPLDEAVEPAQEQETMIS